MYSMRILWTHSSFEEEDLKRRLSDIQEFPKSVTFIHEPLLDIYQKEPVPLSELQKHQAIFITSGHALKALIKMVSLDLPVYTAGDQTRLCAQKEGMKTVISAGGHSQDLKKLLAQTLHPQNGSLLYVRGETVRENIKQDLEKEGFKVTEIIGYEARIKKEFSPKTSNLLKNEKIKVVFLFSKRGAIAFKDALKELDLKKISQTLSVFCLSQDVSKELNPLEFKVVHYSKSPDLKGLWSLFMEAKKAVFL